LNYVKFGRRRLRFALTGSALVLATMAGGSSAATGATAATTGPRVGDNYRPIVVGVPDLNLPGAKQAGGIDAYFLDTFYYPHGVKQRLTEQKLGLVGAGKGDLHRFGASAVIARLNNDEYPDLVVGAPGVAAKGIKGRVVLLFGSEKGITAKGAQVLSAGEAGDEFGASVVSSQHILLSQHILYVGAPGHDQDGIANAGALYRYSISAKGKATAIDRLTQSLPALGGISQADQRFGEVLAPGDDGVVIGLPNAVVGSAVGAGEMIHLHAGRTSATFTAEIWTQDSPGVPGTAEAGDHFGAAVVPNGYAVGIPGEDVGSIVDAGAVQTFIKHYEGPNHIDDEVFEPRLFITQADAKLPGRVEAGDRFGAALTSGILHKDEENTLVVGAPGEDVGAVADAGSVTFIWLPTSAGHLCCEFPTTTIRQGRGLPGTPEAGDALGATLGQTNGDNSRGEGLYDSLLIGAPGEDVGTSAAHRNTGRVTLWNRFGEFKRSFGYSGGDLPALRYGTVFATEEG
jgi:hypothetical protein